MISDFLDQTYVLAQTRAQRDWLKDLLAKVKAKKPEALAALKKHAVTRRQIETAIAALGTGLAMVERSKLGSNTAFIPSNPILCGFQAGMTSMADRHANTVSDLPSPAPRLSRTPSRRVGVRTLAVIDTSATEHLKRRSDAGAITGADRAVTKVPFVEGDDFHCMAVRDAEWLLRATHHLALISREVKAARLVAVEATSVARLEAFRDAINLGRSQLAEALAAGTFDGMIDVRTARDQRVTPLAIVTEGVVA